MRHTELHFQSEGPSLILTGITPLFCVQYPFGVFFSPHGGFYTRVASIYGPVLISAALWSQQGLDKLQQQA